MHSKFSMILPKQVEKQIKVGCVNAFPSHYFKKTAPIYDLVLLLILGPQGCR